MRDKAENLSEHQQNIVATLGPYFAVMPMQEKLDNFGTLVIYAKILDFLPTAEIEAAMGKIVLETKFFPTVAEIVEQARLMRAAASGQRLPDADEAWSEVMRLARQNKLFDDDAYSSAAVAEAAKNFDRTQLGRLEESQVLTARAQFMRIYDAVEKRHREKRDGALTKLTQEQRQNLLKARVRLHEEKNDGFTRG